jgi:hypothetical protein
MPNQAAPKIIQNLTAKRLRVRGEEKRILVLPAFEKDRVLSEDDQKYFPRLDRLEMQNFIRVLGERDAGSWEPQLKMLFMGAVAGTFTITYLVYQFLTDGGKAAADPTRLRWLKIGSPTLFILVMAGGLGLLYLLRRGDRGRAFLQQVNRWIAQALSLLLILAVAMVLPSIAFYLFGGGRELLGGQNSLAKLGRALQLVFIFTASLLPALLYFLFDRQQLGTLRQRFEQQIFRLDPNIQTLCDVRAKYGRQIDEVYGRETATGEGRLARGTRWPILVATLVITVGWMLTLLPSSPDSEMTRPGQLLDFFMPQKSIVTFGFLGAYFFVLNTVLHRYVRADLKPKAYSSITVRVLVVIVLAWVIGLPFGNHSYALVLVFLVGVFPESGLTLIRESIRNQTGLGRFVGIIGSRTKERYPLTELEELDVYDRARLLDEGVTNIESLAHHDLIDLMLETRIPVPRLVDWLDQAVLYLHLQFDTGEDADDGRLTGLLPMNRDDKNEDKATKDKKKKVNPSRVNREAVENLQSLRSWLRGNCVRTATDFIVAYSEGNKSLRLKAELENRQIELDILFETLSDDEWLDYVRHWRNSRTVEEESLDASSSGIEPGQVNVQLKAMNGQDKTYEAGFSINEGMIDSLAPAAELEKIGIQPVGKSAFALSDGTIKEYPFALAQMAFMGEITAGRIIFGPDDAQPALGVTALESVGITIDPADGTLTRLPAIPLK